MRTIIAATAPIRNPTQTGEMLVGKVDLDFLNRPQPPRQQ
jgi:hypothetical protein